ncbi:hypothetical protein MKW94_025056, partial [Papaver nudicaule]|nr:hypothetical protein [Papaver nudicaule]
IEMLSESTDESLKKDSGEHKTEEVGRKLKQAAMIDPILSNLVNGIWAQAEVLQQENEAPEKINPYKFSYDDDDVLEEKSDHEKEMDQLWADFELAQSSTEAGTSAPCA